MAFKRDWSFLDKITMGSVGTKRVIEILNAEGHQIIELERYCTSNKIWSYVFLICFVYVVGNVLSLGPSQN